VPSSWPSVEEVDFVVARFGCRLDVDLPVESRLVEEGGIVKATIAVCPTFVELLTEAAGFRDVVTSGWGDYRICVSWSSRLPRDVAAIHIEDAAMKLVDSVLIRRLDPEITHTARVRSLERWGLEHVNGR